MLVKRPLAKHRHPLFGVFGGYREISLLLMVLLSLLPGCVVPPAKKAKPPSAEQIVGVWLGYTEDELQFYRLDLRPDFTGYCASMYLPDTSLPHDVSLYRIEKWELKERHLTLRVSVVDTGAEAITLKGETTGHEMNLEVAGAGWKRRLMLRPEPNVTIPLQKAKQRVESVQRP